MNEEQEKKLQEIMEKVKNKANEKLKVEEISKEDIKESKDFIDKAKYGLIVAHDEGVGIVGNVAYILTAFGQIIIDLLEDEDFTEDMIMHVVNHALEFNRMSKEERIEDTMKSMNHFVSKLEQEQKERKQVDDKLDKLNEILDNE